MFEIIAKQGKARRATFTTIHGKIETPAFMNVATQGAIKGAVSAYDLKELICQVQLCNTYHLHLRPGDHIVKELGGLHKFTGFDGPILTDSGGFQVFSLAKLRKITEKGVHFSSHIDGRKIFMGPEESIQIQSNLASTIAMAFDECIPNPAPYEYAKLSSTRTVRWLYRCKDEHERLKSLHDTINQKQLLFGINQGSIYDDIRIENMQRIVELDLDGYAIGGLAVGESAEEMYRVISVVEPYMPENKPRYLMGVGTPANIIEAVSRGVDLFDCVLPTRNARHGHLFTSQGVMNLFNEKYVKDTAPIDPDCGCPTCQKHSRAYLRHLYKSGEMLAARLAVMHNLYFYNNLLKNIRQAIEAGTFDQFKEKMLPILSKRI